MEAAIGVVELAAARVIPGTGGPAAPAVLAIDSPEHPMPLDEAATGLAANVVTVPATDWNAYLTPWEAPGLREGAPAFGGKAAELLRALRDEFAPAVCERFGLAPARWAVAGYSLGGLFSLYAFVREPGLAACGCVSGSVWYPGLVEYLSALPLDARGRYAYFSLGRKEYRAGAPVTRTVRDNMGECSELLEGFGCKTDFVLGPGNHMQHHAERMRAALASIDGFLGEDPSRPR